jgi:hypothetical protein
MKLQEFVRVLVFGSAWGLAEATLGAALHFARVPIAGAIMAPIGFAVLVVALRRGLRPSSLAAVSLVAASWKLLDAAALGVPPIDLMVIRPAIAIMSEGLAFALALSAAMALLPRDPPRVAAHERGDGPQTKRP